MIYQVEIQLHNFCNRACWFCPQQTIHRPKSIEWMDSETFEKTLKMLSDGVSNNIISKTSDVLISRYNEIFYKIDDSIDRIARIKETMPESEIQIHTNGDFLNEIVCKKISGIIDKVFVNNYDASEDSEILDYIQDNFKEECINNMKFYYDKATLFTTISFEYYGVKYEFLSQKESLLITVIQNRGGLLFKTNTKSEFCKKNNIQLSVDVDGSIMPCCATYGKIKEHSDLIVSNVYSGIIDIKNSLDSFDQKEHSACIDCKCINLKKEIGSITEWNANCNIKSII